LLLVFDCTVLIGLREGDVLSHVKRLPHGLFICDEPVPGAPLSNCFLAEPLSLGDKDARSKLQVTLTATGNYRGHGCTNPNCRSPRGSPVGPCRRRSRTAGFWRLGRGFLVVGGWILEEALVCGGDVGDVGGVGFFLGEAEGDFAEVGEGADGWEVLGSLASQ